MEQNRLMNMYVGNLSYELTEAEVKKEFEAFGEVESVKLIYDTKREGRNGERISKGFGFVAMPNLAEAQAAIAGLDGKQINGRAMTVSGIRPKSGE